MLMAIIIGADTAGSKLNVVKFSRRRENFEVIDMTKKVRILLMWPLQSRLRIELNKENLGIVIDAYGAEIPFMVWPNQGMLAAKSQVNALPTWLTYNNSHDYDGSWNRWWRSWLRTYPKALSIVNTSGGRRNPGRHAQQDVLRKGEIKWKLQLDVIYALMKNGSLRFSKIKAISSWFWYLWPYTYSLPNLW